MKFWDLNMNMIKSGTWKYTVFSRPSPNNIQIFVQIPFTWRLWGKKTDRDDLAIKYKYVITLLIVYWLFSSECYYFDINLKCLWVGGGVHADLNILTIEFTALLKNTPFLIW